MANFNLYRLHFTTPVHLGDNREDYGISLRTIQSDTLHAAIICCLANIGEPLPADGDLGCAISSLFPFYQKDEKSKAVYFFPKPLKQELPRLEKVENAKKIKKARWFDSTYFEKVINGNALFETEADIDAIRNDYLTNEPIDENFITSSVSPRVTVSHTGDEDANPFYMDRVYFKDRSGLFFITTGDTELLEKGLAILQYEGVGTDRNVGNGYFEFEKDTIELALPSESELSMSLSMFIPENKQQLQTLISGDDVAYDFTRRGGWISTPPHNTIRKNIVHAFLPASLFSKPSTKPEVLGTTVNLAPKLQLEEIPEIEHPVWRCGKSIFIPVKLK